MKPREKSEIESEIIKHLARGYKTAEVATRMGKSTRTMEWAVSVLKGKYNANNITQLVVIAIKEGIVDIDEL